MELVSVRNRKLRATNKCLRFIIVTNFQAFCAFELSALSAAKAKIRTHTEREREREREREVIGGKEKRNFQFLFVTFIYSLI